MTRCLEEQVSVKQARTKRCSNNKEQSFDEQVAGCMEMTTNSPSNLSHLFKIFIFLIFS
jgi:hypothetical protein